MRVVVMGCGRVGSTIAARLEREGNTVTVVDTDPYSLDRKSTRLNSSHRT